MENVELYTTDTSKLDFDLNELDKHCESFYNEFNVTLTVGIYSDGVDISAGSFEGGWHNASRVFKYGKKPFTLEQIFNKINSVYKALNNRREWTNLMPVFKKLRLPGDIYFTSFGFSYWNIGKRSKDWNNDNEILSNKLNELGIKFTNEYSDAFWVWRYRISQSQENIAKIKALEV